MTIQEKKEYLRRYQVLDADIRQIGEELCEWRKRAMKLTAVISNMPEGSRAGNHTRLAVEQIAQFEKRLDRRMEQLMRVRMETEKAIARLGNPVLRRVLKYRYIAGNSWEKVAVEMKYTTRHVTRLHNRALQQLPL